jgi:hypothetical protein
MGVDRDDVADGNARVEDADTFIFKDQAVMPGCGDDGIELGWPAPGFANFINVVSSLVCRADCRVSQRVVGRDYIPLGGF